MFNLFYFFKDIKCFVIIFFNFFFILVINIYLAYFAEKKGINYLLVLRSKPLVNKRIAFNSTLVKRYYSTSKKADSDLKDTDLVRSEKIF